MSETPAAVATRVIEHGRYTFRFPQEHQRDGYLMERWRTMIRTALYRRGWRAVTRLCAGPDDCFLRIELGGPVTP